MIPLKSTAFDDPLDWDGSEGEARSLTMLPVGPVSHAFVHDTRSIVGIMGPYGSAKTTSCLQKIIWITMWQKPGPDGVRRSRGCVLRETYAQLKSNVMDDFFSWFPKTKDNFNGDEMKSTLKLDIPNFGRLHIEILWRALGDDNKPEKVFKGMQLTWLWLNEADTLNKNCVKFGFPRLGRYPKAKDGGCTWSGMFLDLNAPDNDNWTYDLLVDQDIMRDPAFEKLREQFGDDFGVSFFKQPGGRSPDAENLENLPPGYYERLALTLTENEIRRFVDNEFGAVRNGQPVYTNFNNDIHVSRHPLKAAPGIPIYMSVDGGSTPAALFYQKMPNGQIRVLDELVLFDPANDNDELQQLGPTAFARQCRAFISEKYPDHKIVLCWSDPAAAYGGDDEDLAWRDAFAKELKIRVKDAPVRGNRLTERIETVRKLLERMIDGVPALIISSTCRMLRRGFNNGYVLTRVQRSNGLGLFKDEPDKNDYSHVHDALQYGCCGLTKAGKSIDDADARHRQRSSQPNVKRGGYAGARR